MAPEIGKVFNLEEEKSAFNPGNANLPIGFYNLANREIGDPRGRNPREEKLAPEIGKVFNLEEEKSALNPGNANLLIGIYNIGQVNPGNANLLIGFYNLAKKKNLLLTPGTPIS